MTDKESGMTDKESGLTPSSVTPGLTRGPCLFKCAARGLNGGSRIKSGMTSALREGYSVDPASSAG